MKSVMLYVCIHNRYFVIPHMIRGDGGLSRGKLSGIYFKIKNFGMIRRKC